MSAPERCGWCNTLTDRANGFCSIDCERKWLDDDRHQEFAAEAAMDAAIDAGWDGANDDEDDDVDVAVEFEDVGRD